MTERAVCLACGRPFPPGRLLCANCRQPIGKRDRWHHDEGSRDRWHHDEGSRAVHVDCDKPTGYAPVERLKQ